MLLSTAVRSVVVAPSLGRRAASAIALKYSQAIYGAALKQSPQALNKVHADLVLVSNSIATQPEISSFLNNPTLSSSERSAALSTFFAKLDSAAPKKDAISDTTKNLLTVLSENGRLVETQGVIEGFNELVAQYRGELNVIVTSAAPLTKDVLSRLETTLKSSLAGQKAKVNPSVLGGIIVDFGDKTIDLSVQSRVTKLNNVLHRMCYWFFFFPTVALTEEQLESITTTAPNSPVMPEETLHWSTMEALVKHRCGPLAVKVGRLIPLQL
ncbi:hypothetical protein H0H93_008622 [Arthromyces matolae]|nr:hypothetical protein H0H93_008622 [Arthromyces matolae]